MMPDSIKPLQDLMGSIPLTCSIRSNTHIIMERYLEGIGGFGKSRYSEESEQRLSVSPLLPVEHMRYHKRKLSLKVTT